VVEKTLVEIEKVAETLGSFDLTPKASVVEEKAPSSIVAKKKWARKKGGKLKAKSTKGDIVVGLGKRRLADLTSSGVNQELQTEVSKGGEQKRQLVNMEIDNNKNEEVVLDDQHRLQQ
jgi:hypothetical protein